MFVLSEYISDKHKYGLQHSFHRIYFKKIATTISLSKYPDLALNSVGILILIGGLSLSFTKIARDSIPEPREVGVDENGQPILDRKNAKPLCISVQLAALGSVIFATVPYFRD